MADTKIEWASKVWNPVVGCSIHSPGCTNCYAMKMAGRLEAMAPRANGSGNIGLLHYVGTTQSSRSGFVWTGKVNVAPDDTLTAPLRRRKPTDYFVNSMSDLFHADVPDEVIYRVFAVMALTSRHTYKVLTKRSARMLAVLSNPEFRANVLDAASHIARDWKENARAVWHAETWPLSNVWLGVSVEDQARADERREDFRATPAAVKFVSYEPALGPVDWTGWEFVQQIISGGESGPKARPANPQWFRDTNVFCRVNRIAHFHKQNGEFASVSEVEGPGAHHTFPDGRTVRRVGKKRAGRLLDGVEHNGMPEVHHG